MKRVFVAVFAAGLFAAGGASAQGLDFGAWCSDVGRFDANRCLEQRPEDKASYDA